MNIRVDPCPSVVFIDRDMDPGLRRDAIEGRGKRLNPQCIHNLFRVMTVEAVVEGFGVGQ